MSSPTVTAQGGAQLPIGDLPQVLGYTGSLLTSITVVYPPSGTGAITYKQTLSYTGSNLTGVSQWIPQ